MQSDLRGSKQSDFVSSSGMRLPGSNRKGRQDSPSSEILRKSEQNYLAEIANRSKRGGRRSA